MAPSSSPAVWQWAFNRTPHEMLTVVQSLCAIFLIAVFLVAFTARSIATASKDETVGASPTQLGPGGKPLPRGNKKDKNRDLSRTDFSRNIKLVFIWVTVAILVTFAAKAALTILHTLVDRKHNWWCGQAYVIYVVGTLVVFTCVLISLVDTQPSPTIAHFITWSFALPLELMILGASLAIYTSEHREPKANNPHGGKLRKGITNWETIEVVIDLVRIVLILGLIVFYAVSAISLHRALQTAGTARDDGPSEASPLLPTDHEGNGSANGAANGTAYGTGHGGAPVAKKEARRDAWSRPVDQPSKSWWEYLKGYSVFFPYLWPSKSLRLKITVVICFTLLILQRVVNVMVPIQVGSITTGLSGEETGTPYLPWGSIILYILYRSLQGSQGILGAIRAALWIPIGQYSYRELSTAAFEHVHGLSLDFHLGKKTGEVVSALNKGGSINTFLEQVTFQVLPMLVDLGVAIAYFLIAFDAYYALVVAIVTFFYLYITIRMAQWRAEIRRKMVNADRQEDAVKNDSMVSYETVKYFNAESYEFARYRNAVLEFQSAEAEVLISLNLMNTAQMICFMMGLLITCFIAAYQVSIGQLPVGKFVTLLIYMAQLQAPLNFFGTFYRSIQSALINSERMLELFKEKPTVVDPENAQELSSCQGDIRFNNVSFAYDARKPALDGLDFECAPGTTTALVGESGGGKSTVFRLLFRFYNVTSGGIQIDGHDVRDLSIESVRRAIGVVPQDTVLFNESVMYNLRYANQDATDEQVYEACRAASIHDKILNFPDGYDTKVGERGLRLSGGEKQRVAIARTILKDPRIILLDEATAALDTETEQHIQKALALLSKGRTSLIIAHRLSTITTADQILVLHAGKVVEKGTHFELIALKGRYATMWRKQIRAERAAAEAQVLKDKAERLQSESAKGSASGGEESTSQSEDESLDRLSALASPTKGAGTGFRSGLPDTSRNVPSSISSDQSSVTIKRSPASDEGAGDSHAGNKKYGS